MSLSARFGLIGSLALHALRVDAAAPNPGAEELLDNILLQVIDMTPLAGKISLPIIPDGGPSDGADNQTATINVASDWYIPVTIGTPPQAFLFLGDSGSPSIAVGSTFLPKAEQLNSPKYNPNASSTAEQLDGYTYNLCFASGYCSGGVVYQDAFTVGDLTIDDMYINVQTHNSGPSNGTRSGTLGLNFDQNGQTTHPTKLPNWLQSIMPHLRSALFTVDFNPKTANGSFEFGSIDQSRYTGDIGYAPVNQTLGNGEWTIQISGQQLANGTFVPTDDWWVTVDTGTAGSKIPQDAADTYFAQIHGSTFSQAREAYTFPCSSPLVDFTFGVDSFRGTIPADQLQAGSTDGGNTCISKINVGGDGNKLIWGRTFIEQLFVVFDWENARVGFANKDL